MPKLSEHPNAPDSDATIRGIVLGFLPTRAPHWVGAGLAFGAVGIAGAAAVMLTGVLDLSATAPHPEGWARVLHGTFQRSVAAHAEPLPASVSLDDPAMIMLGAAHYANVCATCHGAPGIGQNPVALSMRPEPPMLLEAANTYSDGELFHIVDGGVRYSAMPAWPVSNRPDEVWAVVAFLKALPGMDRARYEQLAFGDDGPATTLAATGTDGSSLRGKGQRPYLPGDAQSIFASPHAADRPATGFVNLRPMESIASACVSCHGADGAGRSGGAAPNLTLQSPEYLTQSLNAFASGDRQSGIMWPVAANLSPDDIKRLARDIGGAEAKPSRGPSLDGEVDPQLLARGQEIALKGIPAGERASADVSPGVPTAAAVQACQGCHGDVADRAAAMPQIAGQNQTYLANQMRLFRDHGRGNSLTYNPMSIVSHRLADPDIDALATYYASLPPHKEGGAGTAKN